MGPDVEEFRPERWNGLNTLGTSRPLAAVAVFVPGVSLYPIDTIYTDSDRTTCS